MGFRQADNEGRGGWATLWCADIHENYSTARMSTFRKKKDRAPDNPTYETDFLDGFVKFIGPAHSKLKDSGLPTAEEYASKKDNYEWTKRNSRKIQIKSCETTKTYDFEQKKANISFIVYSFDYADGAPVSANKPSNGSAAKGKPVAAKVQSAVVEEDEDDLPF